MQLNYYKFERSSVKAKHHSTGIIVSLRYWLPRTSSVIISIIDALKGKVAFNRHVITSLMYLHTQTCNSKGKLVIFPEKFFEILDAFQQTLSFRY